MKLTDLQPMPDHGPSDREMGPSDYPCPLCEGVVLVGEEEACGVCACCYFHEEDENDGY